MRSCSCLCKASLRSNTIKRVGILIVPLVPCSPVYRDLLVRDGNGAARRFSSVVFPPVSLCDDFVVLQKYCSNRC